MTATRIAVPPGAVAAPRSMVRVVAGLTGAKVLGAATGFITGPLLARALGASGRGDLAAILVPFSLAPLIVGLGIAAYPYRSIPQGARPDEVIGSLGLPLLLIGVLTAAVAVPVADALAGGRATVRTYLIIGLAVMPVVLVNGMLGSVLAALQRWRALILVTLIPFIVPFTSTVLLYLLGDLTVATAAIGTIAGSLLSMLPAAGLLRHPRGLLFDRGLARAGIGFGVRSWLGGIAQLANLRLDQFLMITVVSPRVLGLYAVATTLAGASGLVTGAISPPLMTRVAAGETALLPFVLRVTIAALVITNLGLALVTPLILDALFGPQFHDAVPMALILLIASVPWGAANVLSSGIQAGGSPLIPSVGEAIALVITVVGLIALLPSLGGIGAAIVSVVAYSASFIFQLCVVRWRSGVGLRHYLIASPSDLARLIGARAAGRPA